MVRLPIALITGANRGIGFEVARQLVQRGFSVMLAARDEDDALQAAKQLGPMAAPLRLDVSDRPSIVAASKRLLMMPYIDVLVNNAGVVFDDDKSILSTAPQLLRDTLRTNTLGPLLVTQIFHPLLAKSPAPRIINVSSGGGQLEDGADGWAPAYCISKTALNAVTVQLAAALPAFAVNSVCPGWVRTRMGGPDAPRSVEEGADSIVWLAAEAPQSLTGKFIKNRAPIPW